MTSMKTYATVLGGGAIGNRITPINNNGLAIHCMYVHTRFKRDPSTAATYIERTRNVYGCGSAQEHGVTTTKQHYPRVHSYGRYNYMIEMLENAISYMAKNNFNISWNTININRSILPVFLLEQDIMWPGNLKIF